MKQSDFASRLSQALEARGMKAADLSKKTKVAEGTISCYINGRYEAKQNRVQVFAEALNVNPAWLMGYDVPMEAERSTPAKQPTIPPGFEPMPEMVQVPLIGAIACGTPITAEQNIEQMVCVPSRWGRAWNPASMTGTWWPSGSSRRGSRERSPLCASGRKPH